MEQKQLQEANVQEAVQTVPQPEKAESMADYARELERSFRKIGEGDILSGTVIDVSETGVILDLQYYAQGVIRAEDMSDSPTFSILQDVKVGDVVEASVVRMDDGQGNILLSRKNATEVLVWEKLSAYQKEGRVLSTKVQAITNGGVICYVEDTRGFVPASQLALEYVEELEGWLGRQLQVQVLTVNAEKKKLVLSAKAVLKAQLEKEHKDKLAMVIPGSVLEGTVESLAPYGAFVNLGDGLSGLVHISQISQKRIKTPGKVLNVGQKVKAKVLNTDNGKIALSIKALGEDLDREVDTVEELHYESDGEATTSLAGLFAKLKL